MASVSVILIEDSALMRLIVSDILKSDSDIRILGTASNGKEGAELAARLNPDVVITDLVMPEFDGIHAIKTIRQTSNVPILILSAAGGESTMVFDAINAGGTEFLEKPQGSASNIRDVDYSLVSKVKSLANAKVGARAANIVANNNAHNFAKNLPYHAVVIGSSTGGPSAVEEVLSKLPANFPIPVMIAQHMPKNFIIPFAKRLNGVTPLSVKVAEENEVLAPGMIYVAPGHANPEVHPKGKSAEVKFNQKKYPDFNNPSVTSLFETAATAFGKKTIAVMLTGMGKDGATGMKQIFDKGGMCIAQEKSTCVVFGMPGAAVEIGAVHHQVKLKDIASFIVSCISD